MLKINRYESFLYSWKVNAWHPNTSTPHSSVITDMNQPPRAAVWEQVLETPGEGVSVVQSWESNLLYDNDPGVCILNFLCSYEIYSVMCPIRVNNHAKLKQTISCVEDRKYLKHNIEKSTLMFYGVSVSTKTW